MEFKSSEVTARLRHPQKEFEEVELIAEVRWDPLTGRAGRITAHKDILLPSEKELPDISDIVGKSRKVCAFCPPLLDAITPKLPSSIFDEEKMERNGTLLFPNLFPYGAASCVCIYGRDHHYIEIGKFDLELQTAALINCRDYIKKYQQHDPAFIYSSVTQNYLPPSGGSFVHPHLQAQVDKFPHQHHLDLIESARGYYGKTGSNYWEDLIEEEERRGERWIGRTGGWAWYAPFAPMGFKEIAAALPGKRCVTECSDDEMADLARGIDDAQQYYRKSGCNSFNFGFYSVASDEPAWTLCFRMIMRSNFEPWYRSDRTHHEVMLGEAAVPELPERVAENARPHFTA